ncbi:ATP-dependent nuclease subunit B [Streptococcus merionis]|uniref:ATP-dependent nuclease subunit B n=1 Tax=Streptococcus merionis TaxID=400065 RepID=UPI003510DCB0
MKLIYTDISQDLTEILVGEAVEKAASGRRVFYIAPNSLSFEKERQVLELLPQQASFEILVTRFGQMVRYVTLNEIEEQTPIDDTGLSMLFYRALSSLPEDALRVYGRLKQNMDFIQQLVALYQELLSSQLSIAELTGLDSADKQADLQVIFHQFYELLTQENYQSQSKIQQLTQEIMAGHLAADLASMALVIDGFTRFSVEEEHLVKALEAQGVPIVIGTYASQEAYQASYVSGNLYQAGVDFLRELAQTYAIKPEFRLQGPERKSDALARISQKFAAYYDFSVNGTELTEADKERVSIWEVISQKEEVVHVAKAIRRHLHEGYRYKDILVLLGDVDSYRLQIGKIFDQYEIPYYLGKAEPMSQHPLVNLVDSLLQIKRYHYQTDDLINLLKTGLYGEWRQEDLDYFEVYVRYAKIKGLSRLSKPFKADQNGKFDLKKLNQLRATIVQPLAEFLQVPDQSGQAFLDSFSQFLAAVQVPQNLARLAMAGSQEDREQAEQVWQSFTGILEQFATIFGQERLSVEDSLSLIRAGMLSANFRTVPATVDVVNVKSYDLITPRANKLVFAIGLTQGNFPKLSKNTSLVSDEERLAINEAAGETVFEVPSREQGKRNHFTALSLLNAATDHLVLSTPQLFKENEEQMSPYLSQLLVMGLPKQDKGRASLEASSADVGNYKGLLSQVIELNRADLSDMEEKLSETEQTFWAVAVRYLRKKLASSGISWPDQGATPTLATQPLAKETLDKLYPADQPLRLSASSLTDFYNSEYKYFLRHILRLEEVQSIMPDARVHGNFLHKVFEEVLEDNSSADFDQKVSQALARTSQLEAFRDVYGESSETAYSYQVLTAIAQATATALRDDSLVATVGEESSFEKTLLLPQGKPLNIIGKIDRIDQLKTSQALGIIDYKSSAQSFKIGDFYNGLSPQLMTYILAMKGNSRLSFEEKIFGAMYLHMTDPVVQLSKVKDLDEILKASKTELQFKGLFEAEASQSLSAQYGKTAATTFNVDELGILLDHTEQIYQQAAQKILQGHFAINPYSRDGRSVAGDQYNSITHFEADLHLGQARFLAKLGRKKEDWLNQMSRKGGQA